MSNLRRCALIGTALTLGLAAGAAQAQVLLTPRQQPMEAERPYGGPPHFMGEYDYGQSDRGFQAPRFGQRGQPFDRGGQQFGQGQRFGQSGQPGMDYGMGQQGMGQQGMGQQGMGMPAHDGLVVLMIERQRRQQQLDEARRAIGEARAALQQNDRESALSAIDWASDATRSRSMREEAALEQLIMQAQQAIQAGNLRQAQLALAQAHMVVRGPAGTEQQGTSPFGQQTGGQTGITGGQSGGSPAGTGGGQQGGR